MDGASAASSESGRVVVAACTPGKQKPALSLSPPFFLSARTGKALKPRSGRGWGAGWCTRYASWVKMPCTYWKMAHRRMTHHWVRRTPS